MFTNLIWRFATLSLDTGNNTDIIGNYRMEKMVLNFLCNICFWIPYITRKIDASLIRLSIFINNIYAPQLPACVLFTHRQSARVFLIAVIWRLGTPFSRIMKLAILYSGGLRIICRQQCLCIMYLKATAARADAADGPQCNITGASWTEWWLERSSPPPSQSH